MLRKCVFITVWTFLLIESPFAQKLKKADKLTLANLEAHVTYLADDKLEGRRAGSVGEGLAMKYIREKLENYGVQPKGTDGFYQPFDIPEGRNYDASKFSINDVELKQQADYFPLGYSAQKSINASPSISLKEMDMPWFIDLKETLEENKDNPHFDLNMFIKEKVAKAYDKKATALIIYNTGVIEDKLGFNKKEKLDPLAIPVIYVTKEAAAKYFQDATATLDIKMDVKFQDKKRIGHNVVGYIDNGAAYTIVMGAHFDHLGYGEDGNSMIRSGEMGIHNGADDNASGTAALLELARLVKGAKSKNYNYLCIAFSGEELGLFGSKFYVENPTIDLKNVTCMINLDMVGRLNDSTHALTVGGYGTSPAWATYIKLNEKKPVFTIKIDSSGSGPSDHTSFYRKDIPVLFFFTGLHKDYHKPSDDANLINYTGELTIVNYINALIEKLNKDNTKLSFTKTREVQMASKTSFKVTLGVMADYTYSGAGVKVDGVSEGRPAAKAGVQAGDLIIQLGPHATTSMESYMQALGKFNKGDKTTVTVKRGNQNLTLNIEL